MFLLNEMIQLSSSSRQFTWHYSLLWSGDNERFVRVTGGCLHVDVYSGPENIPSPRESFDAKVWIKLVTINYTISD